MRVRFHRCRLALQGILALTCLRNGIFLMHNYSRPNDEDLELELQCASHLYVTGTFGFIVGPFYWDFLAWRALKFRMHPTYMFYFTVEFLLEDACLSERPKRFVTVVSQRSS